MKRIVFGILFTVTLLTQAVSTQASAENFSRVVVTIGKGDNIWVTCKRLRALRFLPDGMNVLVCARQATKWSKFDPRKIPAGAVLDFPFASSMSSADSQKPKELESQSRQNQNELSAAKEQLARVAGQLQNAQIKIDQQESELKARHQGNAERQAQIELLQKENAALATSADKQNTTANKGEESISRLGRGFYTAIIGGLIASVVVSLMLLRALKKERALYQTLFRKFQATANEIETTRERNKVLAKRADAAEQETGMVFEIPDGLLPQKYMVGKAVEFPLAIPAQFKMRCGAGVEKENVSRHIGAPCLACQRELLLRGFSEMQPQRAVAG